MMPISPSPTGTHITATPITPIIDPSWRQGVSEFDIIIRSGFPKNMISDLSFWVTWLEDMEARKHKLQTEKQPLSNVSHYDYPSNIKYVLVY